ncbi:hypothetical protein Scep_017439 [Stephania cephalantha]|uniref:Uncharacterized protein n=1 Tax=Stephania cephalantha TaxID=152367 RepID=A0AAP0IPJ1_9MAGN
MAKSWDPIHSCYVPRELNLKAHSLARRALLQTVNCIWENPPPDLFMSQWNA